MPLIHALRVVPARTIRKPAVIAIVVGALALIGTVLVLVPDVQR